MTLLNTASFRYVLARRKTEEAKVNPTLSLGHYVPSFSGGVSNGCASLLFAILSYCITGKNNDHSSQSTPQLSVHTTTLSPHHNSQSTPQLSVHTAALRTGTEWEAQEPWQGIWLSVAEGPHADSRRRYILRTA